MLTGAAVGVGAMATQRMAELVHARRNESAARARGAVEYGAGHYPLIVALHSAWLAATLIEGRRSRRLRWAPLATLTAAQLLRYWAISSLGRQWTTRILVDPTSTPVTSGPYRFSAHPNYVAVVMEIAAFPLVFEARRTAIVFTVGNAVLLRHRIHVEDAARAQRY